MNIWNRILHRINQKDIALPLGRWKLESCHQRINQKIDSSNEDHCGTCANGTILDKSRELPTTALVPYHISSVLPSLPTKEKQDNQISILSENNGNTSRS